MLMTLLQRNVKRYFQIGYESLIKAIMAEMANVYSNTTANRRYFELQCSTLRKNINKYLVVGATI